MKIAFLFAGQGSQYVGMGQDFYNEYDEVKKIYDKFPEIRDLCFYGDANILNQTMYAQKAILLTSYAISQILKIKPEYVCGLSLGEYTALAYSNVWNIDDAIKIITERGRIMQGALPLGTTMMAAVIGMDRDVIKNAISTVKGVCEIANYNCKGQIVITGEIEAVKQGMENLKAAGAKRVIPLNVSGAFHSSLLIPASYELREILDKYKPNKPSYKVVYNISGKEEKSDINDILQSQICHSVYFEDTINYLHENGVDTFIEIGPGSTLSSFVKKTLTDVNVISINKVEDLKNLNL